MEPTRLAWEVLRRHPIRPKVHELNAFSDSSEVTIEQLEEDHPKAAEIWPGAPLHLLHQLKHFGNQAWCSLSSDHRKFLCLLLTKLRHQDKTKRFPVRGQAAALDREQLVAAPHFYGQEDPYYKAVDRTNKDLKEDAPYYDHELLLLQFHPRAAPEVILETVGKIIKDRLKQGLERRNSVPHEGSATIRSNFSQYIKLSQLDKCHHEFKAHRTRDLMQIFGNYAPT